MEKDYSDIVSMFNYENILDSELLCEITDKAFELADLIKKLRAKYKEANRLPLAPYEDEYENMMTIVSIIEDEALKFGKPMKIQKSVIEYSDKEINKIKKNPMELSISGLDEWVDEGLI